MEFNQYIRKPFSVEALEITEENFKAVAKLVGSAKTKDGTRRTKEGVEYIALDRRLIPSVRRAYVGWYLTRLGEKYRCYSPTLFNAQFIEGAIIFPSDEVDE